MTFAANHVDYYERVVMVKEELDEVLSHFPSVFIQRVDGRVVFTQSSGDREITEDDLKRTIQMYNDDFWAKYRTLQDRDKSD